VQRTHENVVLAERRQLLTAQHTHTRFVDPEGGCVGHVSSSFVNHWDAAGVLTEKDPQLRHEADVNRVQLAPIGSAAAGSAVVLVLWVLELNRSAAPLPAVAWLGALAYLLVSNSLLLRGLRRRAATRFGPANAITSIRSILVGLITGLVIASFTTPIPVAVLVGLTVPALALDAVDGWVARRTGSASELGARFDMEVDAFLILVLSVFVAPSVGGWVLAIGAARYALVLAESIAPWLRRPAPPRYWCKCVAVIQAVTLTVVASGHLPAWAGAGALALALALLAESFGREVWWKWRHRPASIGRHALAGRAA
jgi:phosphatidylglycerophosphate synthase